MAQVELRCENRILHGILNDGFVEVKCKSARCGAQRGTVIIHRFAVSSGVLLETLKFSDPAILQKGR